MTVAGATINSPLEFYLNRGSLTVDSGTVNITKDVKIGTNGDATLTMNGGTLTVGPWTRFENSSYAKTINLNGGTLVTYRINKQGGSGATANCLSVWPARAPQATMRMSSSSISPITSASPSSRSPLADRNSL